MNTNDIQFARVAMVMKDIMRKQGLKYGDLAKKLKMSESGLKKIMAGKDCSLNKMARICGVLEVPMDKLIAAAVQNPSMPTPLTSEQRKVLNSDETTYRVLACLQMQDYDLRAVVKTLGMTKEQAYPHLKKLDEVKLIEWKKGDKIKTFAPLYYDFKGVPASVKQSLALRQFVLNKAVSPDLENSTKGAIRKIHINPIRPELLEEMNTKILKIIDDYMWQNVREWELYPKKDMVRTAWVYSCFPYELEDVYKKNS